MMNLITCPILTGHHVGGWRDRDAYADSVSHLAACVERAKVAERGKLDAFFLADGNAVRDMDKPDLFAANYPSARPAAFEPVTLYAALSQHTRNLGFVATATTTYEEPYTLARKFVSSDLLSGGRAGWNVVTSSYAGDSLNYGKAEHAPREDRYSHAEEFVEIVSGLWDSWAYDGFPQNKETGRYLDPTEVQELNFRGKHFSVKGPLNVERSPQGKPVLFSAGQSDQGKELAAAWSEAVFGAATSKEVARADYADIKRRMPKYGRAPDSLRFLPGVCLFIGRTAAEAEEHYQELAELISPVVGVQFLSKLIATDLSGYPVDGPLPQIVGEVAGGTAQRTQIAEMARREGLTIKQTYERVTAAIGNAVMKGTPTQIADEMEDWYRSKACDGFVVVAPAAPRGLNDIVDFLVPELQRRKLFRPDYVGITLRENMGLEIPERQIRGQNGTVGRPGQRVARG